MKKLIAVHMLILASQVRGVLDEVFPGKAFLATPEEVTFLVGRGAARLPSQAEQSLPLTLRAGADAVEVFDEDALADGSSGADDTQEDTDGSVALNDLTVAQLIEMATAEGVDLGTARKKADIIVVIENAWADRSGSSELI